MFCIRDPGKKKKAPQDFEEVTITMVYVTAKAEYLLLEQCVHIYVVRYASSTIHYSGNSNFLYKMPSQLDWQLL